MRLAVAASILFAAAGQAADVRSSVELRLNVAATQESRDLQTAAVQLDLEGGIAFDSGWSLTSIARVRGDREDRLEPGRPSQQERSDFNRRWLLGDRTEAELRELYLDGRVGSTFVRIGKQQIVWGQADGLRVLDVVNPFSFREFVWPDPEDRRIALWSLKSETPLGGATLQLLWIPDPTYDEIPEPDAAFAITTPLLIPARSATQSTRPVPVLPVRRPSNVIDGSDAGARVATFVGGWDLTLNYLYHYHDDPVPFIQLSAAGANIAPSYERTRLLGMTFAKTFGSTTLRGELGHSTDRWFITTQAADPDRVFASDEAAFVVGLDNTMLDNLLVSMQYFESRVLDPSAGMTRSRTERQATFLLQRTFRNETIKFRTLWLHSLNRDDGGFQSRLSWQATQNTTLGFSLERFYGDRRGLFGEFRDASRAGVDVQWAWQE
jgi:hypothetical protein